MQQIWDFLSNDSVTTLIALAGLIISTILAINEYKRKKLNIKIDYALATLSENNDELFFIKLLVSNRSNLPFDLFNVKLVVNNVNTTCTETAYTIDFIEKDFRADHVLVSTKLPLTFLPYQSKEVFLSFVNFDIASRIRQLEETQNQEVQKQASSRFVSQSHGQQSHTTVEGKFYLSTTRGIKPCRVLSIDYREQNWLSQEAIRKSIYEKTAKFL